MLLAHLQYALECILFILAILCLIVVVAVLLYNLIRSIREELR